MWTPEKCRKVAKGANLSAKGISIAAPIIATATQFPLWVESGGEATALNFATPISVAQGDTLSIVYTITAN